MIVDAQVHVWEPDSAERPWDREFARTRSAFLDCGEAVTAERALAAMDEAGVDAALLVSFLLYDDIDYVVEAARRHPSRFAVVAQVDVDADDPLRLAQSFLRHDAVVGVRLAFSRARGDAYGRLEAGELDPVLSAAEAADVAVMVTAADRADVVAPLAERFPAVRFILDHLGLPQSLEGVVPERPFAGFEKVLELARLDNVAVKITGAPTLSKEGYPFPDLRAPMRQLLDRFTAERVLWGSDFSRIRPLYSLGHALDWVRSGDWLSPEEKEWVLGRALMQIVRWPKH